MRIRGPSRRLRVRVARVSTPISPHQPRAFRPAWWALVGWSARITVGCGPTVQQPAATAHGPAPATRVRVVLLPHARAEPPDTQANNRRTGGVTGMNQGDSGFRK